MCTLAPNFEANVYINPKLQTWRLMCTLFPNLEAKVNFNFQLRFRLGLVYTVGIYVATMQEKFFVGSDDSF